MMPAADVTPAEMVTAILKRINALITNGPELPASLRQWHAASFDKTLRASLDGKLSTAALVFELQHDDTDRDLLSGIAAVCACLHTAADVADDCEDGDLRPEIWSRDDGPHAINVSSGLLFLVYRAIAELPIDNDRRLALLKELSDGGWAMHVGQFGDLAATNQPTPADYRWVNALKGGAEIGAFLATAAIALGRDPAPYRRLGASLGSLIQVASDAADVWLEPVSGDLVAAKQGLPVATALPLGGHPVRLALAGDRHLASRQQELRRVMCRPQVVKEFRHEVERLADEALASLMALADEPGLAALTRHIVRDARELGEALAEAMPELRRRHRRGTAPLRRLPTDQAIEFLKADPQSRESWDIQRWGLFGRSEVIGDLFGPAVIAEILLAAGAGPADLGDWLASRRDEDGWRFYPGLFELPCDSDDLGQIIRLYHRLGYRGTALCERVAPALPVALAACRQTGYLRTWFASPQCRTSVDTWLGDDCPAVMGNALFGFALLGLPEWRPILDQTVNRLLQVVDDDGLWTGTHYPERHLATMLVVQGLVAYLPQVPATQARYVQSLLQRTAETLVATQRLDGGWGTPQQTACAMSVLALLMPGSASLAYGARYLTDSQAFDGGWAGEATYMAIGPDMGDARFVSRSLTTAWCLQALTAVFTAGAAPSPGVPESLPLVRLPAEAGAR